MSKTLKHLSVGTSVQFSYPRHNFHGVLSPLETRRLKIESIRDLKREPIEEVTFELQPLLRRGRYLITGTDLDKSAERSFYVDSIKSLTVLPRMKPNRRQTVTLKNTSQAKSA